MDDIQLSIADLFRAEARGQKFAVYVPNQGQIGFEFDGIFYLMDI